VVTTEDVVIDVGSGIGILGFLAAQAGAKQVILVENTRVIADSMELAKVNGLDPTITFFHGSAFDFDLDVRANIIVSEWIGYFLMEEYMYGAFAAVRDRCLIEGGVVVPSAARLYLAPMEDSKIYQLFGFGFWESPLHGFDVSLGKTRLLERPKRVLVEVPPESLLAEPCNLLSIDCLHDGVEAVHFESTAEFEVRRTGSLHGFAGWFELDLTPNVLLDTSPFAVSTHWSQVYFPIPRVSVERGDRIEALVRTSSGGAGPDVTIEAVIYRGTTRIHSFGHTYRSEA
jgi:hypothetical protein